MFNRGFGLGIRVSELGFWLGFCVVPSEKPMHDPSIL